MFTIKLISRMFSILFFITTLLALTFSALGATPAHAERPNSIAGSTVTPDYATYAPGVSNTYSITAYNASVDVEWLNAMTITFPAGWTITAMQGDVSDSCDDPVDFTASGIGANMGTFANIYGQVYDDCSWTATFTVTVPADAAGDQTVNWDLSGDGYGDMPPHDISGSFTLAASALPPVTRTPTRTPTNTLVPTNTVAPTKTVTPHAAGMRYAKSGGTGDCSSWANACTLQTALTGATYGDEIWVQGGTYKPTGGTDRTATFQLKDGVAIYGGFAGTETARSQRSLATHLTILSGEIGAAGNNDNSVHVVSGASGATLDGFTITAGSANALAPDNSGAGMYNDGSSPTLTNVVFSGNSATSNGGGMYNSPFSDPTLTNVIFSGNSATSGGGMYNDTSSPTLMNVTFSGNTAGGGGGGMANVSSSPTLTNVTFSGNSGGGSGGGMHNEGSNPTLTNVTFSGNITSTSGGGMYNGLSSTPLLVNVTFSGNSANFGGAMENQESSDLQITNTIFWGNTAVTAGTQIYNDDTSIASIGFSVVQGGCPVGSTCANTTTANPLLGALGNYGGFTQTIPLRAGSSAIDTGNDLACPSKDQRGYARPVDGDHNGSAICDIGAYEAVYAPPTYTPTPTRTRTPTPTRTRTPTPTRTPTIVLVKIFNSVGAQDGWVLESSEISGKGGTINSGAAALNLGDNATKQQYRDILSFSTGAGLPDNAVITGVTLKVKKQTIFGGGNPVIICRGFMVDIKSGSFGTPTLQINDFQAAANKTYGPFNTTLVGGWYSINLTGAGPYVNKVTTNSGLTQIRLRFKLDDNNNTVANYLNLFSGNAPVVANRPQLVITYNAP